MRFSRSLPVIQSLRGYNAGSFRGDLVSGLTIGFMLIPQGMAYAIVAGLPPEYGLYASIFPPLVYALLGTSNKVSSGPVALDSILIITGLSALAQPGSEHYVELAIGLALLVGCIQFVLGLARFGFLVSFLSLPVITGYTSAAAVIIIVSQLGGLVGYSVAEGNPVAMLGALLASVDSWQPVTCAVGLASMLFIVSAKKFVPRAPYAILLVVVGMLAAGWLGLREMGVAVVDSIPQGLPVPAPPDLSAEQWLQLLPVAVTVSLMGYIGTISISKSVETPADKMLANPNRELLALGAANLVGSLFRAFPVSASFSRSAVFRESGAHTQISAIVSSLLLILVLLYLAPLFERFPLPKALLSAMIVMSVFKLVAHRQFRRLYSQSRREALVMLVTFLLTLALGVQLGLIIGVVASVLVVIYNSSRPHMTELGLLDEDQLYRNVSRFDRAVIRQEVLIFRFDAMLYFANADFFKQQLYRWVAGRDSGQLRAVVLNAESISSIDSTAMLMLLQVIENLRNQGVSFYLSNAIGPVRDQIRDSSLADYLPASQRFATVEDAVRFIDEGIHYRSGIAHQTNS